MSRFRSILWVGRPDPLGAELVADSPSVEVAWTRTLDEGRSRGLLAAPRQVRELAALLDEWVGSDWFADFVCKGPEAFAGSLGRAAESATDATSALRAYLLDVYLPDAEGTPDAVGEERYRRSARQVIGADVDPHEAYAWGWSEYLRIRAEMETLAERILPGSTPVQAMRHLDEHGTLVHGVEEVRVWLQDMMDEAIGDLDGTHFDIAEPLRTVEAMIAPPGSAAAPYYTRPSMDFSRPGRTWLPTPEERLGVLWRFVELLREHFGTDERGQKRMMRFLPWHMNFFCRYVPLPEDPYEEQARSHPLLQSRLQAPPPESPLERLLADARPETHLRFSEELLASTTRDEALARADALARALPDEPAAAELEVARSVVAG